MTQRGEYFGMYRLLNPAGNGRHCDVWEAMHDGKNERFALKIIKAFVPLSEMFGYATDIRSRTQGRGSFTMHFGRYEEVPGALAEEIVSKVQGKTTK